MATSFNRVEIARQKLANVVIAETLANGGGPFTKYYALDPSRSTSILITHHASDTPLVSTTNTLDSNDDLEHANVLWGQTYDGTSTPYNVGDSRGLTGIKVTVTPTNGDVDISIIQYGRRN